MTSAHDDLSDIPAEADFHAADVARAWADAALLERPWRSQFFDRFVSELVDMPATDLRVLELGSGPGFLAEQILRRVPSVGSYTLLDFSQPMLAMSRERLGEFALRARTVQADFKEAGWPAHASGPFEVVLCMQAVHELRHKRHAAGLYLQVMSVLTEGGAFLICDHLPGRDPTPTRAGLYMTEHEQLTSLASAGFHDPAVRYMTHDMAFYSARRRAATVS